MLKQLKNLIPIKYISFFSLLFEKGWGPVELVTTHLKLLEDHPHWHSRIKGNTVYPLSSLSLDIQMFFILQNSVKVKYVVVHIY